MQTKYKKKEEIRKIIKKINRIKIKMKNKKKTNQKLKCVSYRRRGWDDVRKLCVRTEK